MISCEGFEVGFPNLYQGSVLWRSQTSLIMDDLDLFFKVTEQFFDDLEDKPCDHNNLRRIWGRLSKLIPGMCRTKFSDEFDNGWPWPTFQGHRAIFRFLQSRPCYHDNLQRIEVGFPNWYHGCVPWRSRMRSIMDDLDLLFKVTEQF